MNLKNKKSLITGATGGIGNSLIKKFYNLGSTVVATGTNEEKLQKIKKDFSNMHVERFKLDEHDKIEEFIEKIDKKINDNEKATEKLEGKVEEVKRQKTAVKKKVVAKKKQINKTKQQLKKKPTPKTRTTSAAKKNILSKTKKK